MSFAGNLKTVIIGDVLQLISTGRRTGALVLKRPHRGKQIYFRNGDIIAAASEPSTDEERLGQLLLRKGLISVEDLEKALKRQKSTGRRLGQILVELGTMSREDITNALRLQVEEVVYGVFGWTDGDFHFAEGEKPEASQILVELNTLSVMMEGARRFDEYAGTWAGSGRALLGRPRHCRPTSTGERSAEGRCRGTVAASCGQL